MGEINKIVAGLCSTLLVLLGLNFFGELIFHPHQDGEHLAFALEIEDSDGDAGEEQTVDLGAVFAAADPAAGEKVFKKCQACHTVEAGVNKTGPSLHGVVGRKIAALADFGYSGALPADESWTPEHLFHFLESPKSYAPGTSMGFAGLKKESDRADLIAYLNQQSDAPIDIASTLPSQEAAAPAETVTDATTEDTAAAPAAEETASEEATSEQPAAEETASEENTESTEVAAAETTEDAPTAGASDALAGADIAAGEKVFRKCKACHKVEEGANGVGPSLYGIVGRQIASVDGFNYSDALPADQTWTPENLMHFLEKPKDFAPGTKMSFAGLKKEEDRINVVGYLASIGK